jgi:hypothetical protein
MAHHEVILPLEGKLLLPTNNDFILMDVKFFIPADKPSSDQWYASTRVEDSKICLSELTEDDNEERIVALAYDKTELALNLLSFVIKRAISIGKGGYCIGEVDETTNQVPRYHVSKKFTAKYDILSVQSVEEVKKWVDKIHNMPDDKRSVLSTSLSYYREALNTSNPFHSIISYFSSMTALVREMDRGLDTKCCRKKRENKNSDYVCTNALKRRILERITADSTNFAYIWEECYGSYNESSEDFSRSAADHGHIDITRPQRIEQARKKVEPQVRAWLEKMIDSLINDNQIK